VLEDRREVVDHVRGRQRRERLHPHDVTRRARARPPVSRRGRRGSRARRRSRPRRAGRYRASPSPGRAPRPRDARRRSGSGRR
jgi:hypothetical protein